MRPFKPSTYISWVDIKGIMTPIGQPDARCSPIVQVRVGEYSSLAELVQHFIMLVAKASNHGFGPANLVRKRAGSGVILEAGVG